VQQEVAVVTETLAAGDFDIAISNNCWASGEPNYQVRRTIGSDSLLQLTNHGGYNNPEVDALLDEAETELDPARQAELYKSAQAIALEEAAIIPLFDQETVIAYRPFVRGLEQRLAYEPTLPLVYLVESD
jgi:peptide/nickel transport system substrate-binding protein